MVKRPPDQRRKLPPELEAFARSDDEKLRIRRPRTDQGRVRDPREGYIVAGVANRDARAVYDVRTEAMRALWAGGEADEEALAQLGELFHDALRLELWRARRLTAFDAFSEEVIGVPVARAEELAQQHAERTGEASTPLTERAVALWLRAEAGLYEGDEGARARIRTRAGRQVMELEVELAHASTALAGAGAKHLPLARTVPEGRGHDDGEERGRPTTARMQPRERGRDEDRARAVAVDEERFTPAYEDRGRGFARERGVEQAQGERHAARDALASARLGAADDDLGAEDAGEPAHLDELADELATDFADAPPADDEGDDRAEPEGELGGELDEAASEGATAASEHDGEPQSEHPAQVAARLLTAAQGAQPPVSGGARLLTRKQREHDGGGLPRGERAAAPAREERAPGRDREGARGFGAEGGRGERPRFAGREDRGASPFGRRDDRGGQSAFGGERGARAERSNERPRFGRGDEARGGFARDRSAGPRGDRPRFGGNDERPRFGGNERPRFGSKDERPRFGNDRPRAGDDRPRFGSKDERPRFGSERPRFGDDRPRPNNERPRFAGAERTRSQGGRDDAPRFGGDRGRTQGDGNDRPRFGDRGGRRDEGPRFGGAPRGNAGRAERPRFGDRDHAGKGRAGDDRARGFGERRSGAEQGRPATKGGHAAGGFGARKPLAPKQEPRREPQDTPRPPRRDDEDDFE